MRNLSVFHSKCVLNLIWIFEHKQFRSSSVNTKLKAKLNFNANYSTKNSIAWSSCNQLVSCENFKFSNCSLIVQQCSTCIKLCQGIKILKVSLHRIRQVMYMICIVVSLPLTANQQNVNRKEMWIFLKEIPYLRYSVFLFTLIFASIVFADEATLCFSKCHFSGFLRYYGMKYIGEHKL